MLPYVNRKCWRIAIIVVAGALEKTSALKPFSFFNVGSCFKEGICFDLQQKNSVT